MTTTATWGDTQEQDKHTILRNRYDVDDWTATLDTNPNLSNQQAELADKVWTAGRAFADVFQSILKPVPRLQEADDLDRAFRPNLKVMGEIMGTPAWDDLRQYTVGDAFLSGVAMDSMHQQLMELYERIEPAQDAADQAAAGEQAYGEACADAGVEPGSPEAQADAMLEAMRADAEAAIAAADAMLDDLGPVIGSGVRSAMEQGAEQADTLATVASGWGLDPGEINSMDPAVRLALAERLTDERMVKITALLGRLRSELWAMESRSYTNGPDEVCDVTLGDDLNRILPSELLLLCDDALLPLFFDKYTSKGLMQYELRAHPKEARGSIIYVEDASGTMGKQGRDIWARALGLALMDIAIRQGRGFRAIVFAGATDAVAMREYDFGDDASTATLEQRLAYAELRMSGGTDFQGPLMRAHQIIDDEYERLGRTEADVVFATDGEAEVDPKWLARRDTRRHEIGYRVFGIAIGNETAATIDQVSDSVTNVRRLTDGTDISAVFRAVSRPKEAA